MPPGILTYGNELKDYPTVVIDLNASINHSPVTQLKGVVTTIYQSQKFKAQGTSIESTQTIDRGKGKEGGGEGRGRGSTRPHWVTDQLVL